MIKVSLSSQIKALRSSIGMFFAFALVTCWFGPSSLFISVFGIGWIIYAVPCFILHVDYHTENKDKEYLISSDKIIIKSGTSQNEYLASNISKAEIIKSASLDRGGIPILGLEYYHFVRITMKNNEQIIMTCLLDNKIDERMAQLRGIVTFRKKTFFCATWLW